MTHVEASYSFTVHKCKRFQEGFSERFQTKIHKAHLSKNVTSMRLGLQALWMVGLNPLPSAKKQIDSVGLLIHISNKLYK